MTWLTIHKQKPTRELDAILELNPKAGKTLMAFLSVAEIVNDSAMLNLCRLRMAQTFGTQSILKQADPKTLAALENWYKNDVFDNKQRAALDFTDQFVIAANNITPKQRTALASALDVSEPSTFVYGLYINEAYLRFLSFFQVERAPLPSNIEKTTSGHKSDRDNIEWVTDENVQTDPRLLAAYYAFNLATCSLHGIDEYTDELVRLRSAEYHDCKFCQSVRRELDKPTGVNDLLDEVHQRDKSRHLTAAQKTALDVLDTFLFHPEKVEDALKQSVQKHFTNSQITELLMKEMFWMSNKPMISLGTDTGPVSTEGYTPFVYDSEGNFVLKQA